MTTKTNAIPSIEASDDIKALKEELAELKKMLKEKPLKAQRTKGERKIEQDEYIPVMNLLPYNLNLSTKKGGQGTVKHFKKFGEVKKVLYGDLVEIMENHSNLLSAGYFYILDPDVIRQHGLDELYENILTKEKIEEIINSDSVKSIDLYKSATDGQKEIIVQLLIDKVRNEPDTINFNIIDRISRESGVNIIEKATDSRRLEELLTKKEE